MRERAGTPIIVLSARGAERDKVRRARPGRRRLPDQALRRRGVAGARPRRAAPRRAPARRRAAVFRTGDLEVDLEHRRVTVEGQEVHLTPTEYELLKVLIAHPNKVLTDRMLLQRVWAGQYGEPAPAELGWIELYVVVDSAEFPPPEPVCFPASRLQPPPYSPCQTRGLVPGRHQAHNHKGRGPAPFGFVTEKRWPTTVFVLEILDASKARSM